MEHKTRTKALSWLLSLAMLLSLVPGMSMTAMADSEVSYQEGSWSNNSVAYATKTAANPTTLASETTAWGDGNWYVVPADGVTISSRITVNGTVNLILTDGNTLTASKGITVAGNNTLNIYAQSEGDTAGALITNGGDGSNAGIGGEYGNVNAGTVNIHGGKINSTGNGNGAGIGGYFGGDGGNITIYGGTVNAVGGINAAGIGGGQKDSSGGNGGNGGTVTIYGGTVTATGGNNKVGAGIGGGGGVPAGNGGTVTIYGGTVTATGGPPNNGRGSMGIGGVCGKQQSSGGPSSNNPTPPKNGSLTVNNGLKVYGGDNANPNTEITQAQLSQIYADSYNETTVYRYMIVKAPPHTHNFSYTADGATITATCGTDGCTLPPSSAGGTDHVATLTIAPPTAGGGAAVLTGDTDAFGVSASNIKYYTKSGSDWTGETTTPPSGNGFYKAEITVGTTYTVSVTYGVNAITTDKEYSEETNHGTVTVPSVATANATVTINTTPAKGYELKTLTVTKAGDGTVTVTKDGNNGSFTMPEENVTVSAEFGMIDYTIDKKPMTNGSVTVKNASDEEISTAHYGDTVTLVAAPDDGFALKSFTVKDSEGRAQEISANNTFTMPASNVTVSATFEGAPFDVTISNAITGGIVAVTSALVNGKARAGSEVTLTVTPAAGYQLETLKYNNTAITASNDAYKFTMPTEAVTVTATFVGKDTSLTLSTAGNSGSTCTAKLLELENGEYKTVTGSLTKKAGEKFILCINKDEAHSYKVSFSSGSPVSMRGFSKVEYEAYINSTKSESLNTYLYWVTMPGVDSGSVNMTVTFATAKTFTILYQPTTSANEVWVKFGYTENDQDKLVTAKMSKDAAMGNAAVWSLKMSAAFNPDKIAFATSESLAESANTEAATVSETSSWSNITDGQYLIVGNNAKTVIAAFTADSTPANANREATVISIGNNATYQIAICITDGNGNVTTPGSVTPPAAPTKTGYDFVGWRGYEGIEEKEYAANTTQISVKENMAFSAVWRPSNPKVKLNLNGGTGISNAEFTVTYNDNTTLASLTPVKSGYSFAGWSVAKDVTEDGKVYTNGAPFDTGTKITADLELTAQWKHVHAYGCVQIGDISSLATKYAAYAPYLHIKICGCGDVDLEAHSLDSSGRCVCGYSKSGATPTSATLDVSYVRQSDNHTMMAELPETVAADSEVSVSAPGKWGSLTFSKWQYRAKGDTDWTDAGAYKMMSFVIPGNMEMRALYVNATTVPEVSMSATTYATTAANMDGEFNSILFQMNYKLPDGYTYVDAGVRSGDNAGISYYELKERTATMDAEAKAITYSLAAALSVLSGELTTFDTSGTEQYYAKRENSVLGESGMTPAKLADYMYQSKPINIKDPPLYWNYKPTVTGQSGSINALTPVGFAQRNNGDHYIYAIAYLTYKDSSGTTHTIYTPALATTLNGISSAGTVSKSGS